MAVLTLHHWDDPQQGIAEMRRVARRLVVFTWDPAFAEAFWFVRDLASTTTLATVESATEALWRDMRTYLREDAGYRPEFVLRGVPPTDMQRLRDRLLSKAVVYGAPDAIPVFLEDLPAGTSLLPGIGVFFRPDEVAFFFTGEDAWDKAMLVAFVDLLLELRRTLPGSRLMFQPDEEPEPYILAAREALGRYADERQGSD